MVFNERATEQMTAGLIRMGATNQAATADALAELINQYRAELAQAREIIARLEAENTNLREVVRHYESRKQ